MKTLLDKFVNFWKTGKDGKLIISIAGASIFLIVCICCAGTYLISNNAAPSPAPLMDVNTMVAAGVQTMTALAPTIINTPKSTLAPTTTNTPKIAPTKTTYILETGWCMLNVGDVSGRDPKNIEYCRLDAREQIQLASNEEIALTLNNLDGKIEVYCALFSLDGAFVMSDVDTIGSAKVTCRP